MAAYTTIDNPELYFQAKTYTGNGSADHAITFDGTYNMQPDIVWIKNRGQADNHMIHDSARGVGEEWSINVPYPTLAISSDNDLTSFDSNGFTISATTDAVNKSSETYTSWNWKESADAGIDIVTFTGNQTARTISHSLSAIPEWMIIKNREHNDGAHVYHVSNGAANTMEIASTGGSGGGSTIWNSTAPTSSVFSVGTNGNINKTGSGIFIYLFAPKQGFSKFGKYTGNGNADGPFIYLGFRPAFLLIKKTSADGNDWQLTDNKRDPFNVCINRSLPNVNLADQTDSLDLDILSNGFKIRKSSTTNNADGATFIFMAFAESPFVNSKGVPTNAR